VIARQVYAMPRAFSRSIRFVKGITKSSFGCTSATTIERVQSVFITNA
jgi:hypothetical protein